MKIKVTLIHNSCLFVFRWLQIAKRIISKSKREPSGEHSKTLGPSRAPVQRAQLYPSFTPGPRHNLGGVAGGTLYGSENDLSLNYNSIGRGVRYSPDGRTSPEIQMYKTRVIYHSRQDCISDHEASV